MRVLTTFPLVDEILDSYSSTIGKDLPGYRNHVYRILNYYSALDAADKVGESMQIASAFHDIGIWTDQTFDYLGPSVARCACYLDANGRSDLQREVTRVIDQHHKLTPCRPGVPRNVERFRRADLIDLSVGVVRFGVPGNFIRSVKASFPNEGFHWRLVTLAAGQFVRNPARPLPMLRW